MSKLIYVVIAGASAGFSESLRTAIEDAGVKVGDKSFKEVELHTLPKQVVDRVELEEVHGSKKEDDTVKVVPKYRGAFMTLSAQQLVKHMHHKEMVKVKLTKSGVQLNYDEEGADEDDDTPTPPPPKK